eukprot:scaffold73_cov118-Cylindrotheca_fusiformis.AAC.9
MACPAFVHESAVFSFYKYKMPLNKSFEDDDDASSARGSVAGFCNEEKAQPSDRKSFVKPVPVQTERFEPDATAAVTMEAVEKQAAIAKGSSLGEKKDAIELIRRKRLSMKAGST